MTMTYELSNGHVAGSISGRRVIKAPRSTQPSIPPGYVNWTPAFSGWG